MSDEETPSPIGPDYTIPMTGRVVVEWSLGQDEFGEVQGWIGVKPKLKGQPNGCVIGWSTRGPLQTKTVDEISQGIGVALTYAINNYLWERVKDPLLRAALEQQVRLGGFRQELDEDQEPTDLDAIEFLDEDELNGEDSPEG